MGMLARIGEIARQPISIGAPFAAAGRVIGGLFGAIKSKAVSLIGNVDVNYGDLHSLRSRRTGRQWIQAYKDCSLLGSVIGRLAEDVAKGQYRLYEMLGEAEDGQMLLKVIHKHPFWRIWQQPNPDMSGYEYRKLGMEYLESDGLWFSWIERENPADNQFRGGRPPVSNPKGWWPIEPWNVIHRPSFDRPFWVFVFKGVTKVCEPCDAIYIRYIDPEFPYRKEGMSPAARVADDVAGYEYASKWNLNLFRNGANPGKLIGIPGSPGAAQQVKALRYE